MRQPENAKPAGKRRPGGRRKTNGAPSTKHTRQKRKAEVPPTQPKSAGPVSGDTDDFEDMLDTMEDYKPPADGGSDFEDGQPLERPGSGSGGEAESDGGGEAGGKRARKRRKRGQKLSALEFEARRAMVKQIADAPAEEQADWLWASYQQHAAASALERGGLAAEGLAALPPHGSLEDRLKTLEPGTWQQAFCGRAGGGGVRQQGPAAAPCGSPTLLFVSPSAIGSVKLIKLCPSFHRACRIAKLFSKHMKVPEQEELLRSQVVCVGAGTPSRLCKLADGGALQLDRLRHVVLDVQLDAKQRDILAIPETRADWWQFYERHLKQRLAAGELKLSVINSDGLVGGGS